MKFLVWTLLFVINSNLLAQDNRYQVIKFDELQKELASSSDHIRVYNFWATWCRPCIKELPYFEALNQKLSDVEVILISFDFKDQHEKVGDFIEKKNIQSQVKILDETNFNEFIEKIDESWSGAIPATLMIDSNDQHYFFEQAFEEAELFETIIKIKQQKL